MKIRKSFSIVLITLTLLSLAAFLFSNYLGNDNRKNQTQLQEASGKLLIIVDMEGISGVSMDDFWFSIKGHPLYLLKRRFLVNEVNAAISGALNAGLNEEDIIVDDFHLTRFNLRESDLPEGVEIIRKTDIDQIETNIEAIFLIGFHASTDTPARYGHSFSYTIESIRKGEEVIGEASMLAYAAGSLNTPIALVTGDSYAIEEMQSLDEECNCVINKSPGDTPEVEDVLKQIENAAERGIKNPRESIVAPEPFQIEVKVESEEESIILSAPKAHLTLDKLEKLLESISDNSPIYQLINFFSSMLFLIIVVLLTITSAVVVYLRRRKV